MSRLAVMVVCLLIGIPAGSSQASPRDAKALNEIVAARRTLDWLTSYRVNVTLAPGTVVLLTRGAAILVEVVNPNRYRSIFTMGALGSAESITVGRETRSRTTAKRSAGRWECKPGEAPVHALLPVLPSRRDEVASITVLGQATTQGAVMRGYDYQKKEGGRLNRYRLYTLAELRRPRRIEAFSAQGRRDATADYFDYNAPITIELPPCG